MPRLPPHGIDGKTIEPASNSRSNPAAEKQLSLLQSSCNVDRSARVLVSHLLASTYRWSGCSWLRTPIRFPQTSHALMYSESAGSRKSLGDVDVLFHDGLYHLFHLVLPNHDYVAHAVSSDCFNWRRVENALFIGDPGSWDDSMLWTVHVSRDPQQPHRWRMFYTGLSRRDLGHKQRIGMAVSDDLYRWKKAPVNWKDLRTALPYNLPGRPPQPPFDFDPDSCFPLSARSEFYESNIREGRHWVSWRDPFYFRDGDRGWLLVAGRVNHGPVIRRGCVAVLEETEPGKFETRPPLHHPGVYDDVEVPNLFRIDDDYYLIGSIREDAKIRYWHSEGVDGDWRSYSDNVLLAAGNYAGRITHDDKGILLWSFFTPGSPDRTVHNLLPPPKRLVRDESGKLVVHSFEGFDSRFERAAEVRMLCRLTSDTHDQCEVLQAGHVRLSRSSGFQAFLFEEDFESFRVRASLTLLSEGKCGCVFRIDRESQDGYYLSLDLYKGVAQIRRWGSGPAGSGEHMMQFAPLQAGYWEQETRGEVDLILMAYGSYFELQIGGRVLLSLADQHYTTGALGFYVESTTLDISHLEVEHLHSPIQSDEHLAEG